MQKFFYIKVQTLETDLKQIKQDCDKLKSSFLTKEKVLCEEITSLTQIIQLKEEDSSNGFTILENQIITLGEENSKLKDRIEFIESTPGPSAGLLRPKITEDNPVKITKK